MAYALVLLSGFAAAIYQVIWQRLLMLFSGADVHSLTIIVAAYLAGLGLGGLAGGRMADRLGPRRSLWAFAAAELAIGVFGLLSKTLYYDVLYARLPQLGANAGITAVVLFLSLLIPTFLMGLALPLLGRALTPQLAAAARIVGSLYGWNTIGAAAGAFAATWILLPASGLETALRWGVMANVLCAIGGSMLARHAPVVSLRTIAPEADCPSPGPVIPFSTWVLVFGITGFIALGLELAWFRILGVMLKSNAFTFGTLLAVYLGGVGLGGTFGASVVHRGAAPGRTFVALQVGSLGYAALSVMLLLLAIANGFPAGLVNYLRQHTPIDMPAGPPTAEFLWLYAALPLLMIGPPTFLMGLSFPFLQRACQSDLRTLGRRVGTLLSANFCGGVLGAMLTGWVLFPAFGTAGTLQFLVALGALLVLPLGRLLPTPAVARQIAGVAIAIAVFVMPSGTRLWAGLHGVAPDTVTAAEDESGISMLLHSAETGQTLVSANGLAQSWIPYGDIHTLLGAVPTLLHPSPDRVAIVGLGSGDTAFSAASRPETHSLVCVEIISAQMTTLRAMAAARPYTGLTRLLADPRIEHVTGDGRAYLRRSAPVFDVIQMDALRHNSAYAGHIYSREYFDLLKRRLKPGGFAVTWAPTVRGRNTFISAFPHVLMFDEILIGSSAPIVFDAAAVQIRADAARDYFRGTGIDISSLIRSFLATAPVRIGPGTPRRMTDLNTDLFPRDEFSQQ